MIGRVSFGILAFAAVGQAQSWEPLNSGVTADLRGISAVSQRVVWVTGSGGTVLRTTDTGNTWVKRTVPGADSLDFRDVHAFDEQRAVILAIGAGDRSRIYDTIDGGSTWALRFKNERAEAFYDCFAFWDERNGIAVSDPVDGRFAILLTHDGGRTWTPGPIDAMPDVVKGAGAFAASGTCIAVDGTTNAWFTVGGVAQPRIIRTRDGGRSWMAHDVPLAGGSAGAGAFSVAFRGDYGVAVGGDYEKPTSPVGVLALSENGGGGWVRSTAPPDSQPRGYRSAVAFVTATRDHLVAVGTSGSDYSDDGGRAWRAMEKVPYNAVGRSPDGGIWAVGPRGRIGRMPLHGPYR